MSEYVAIIPIQSLRMIILDTDHNSLVHLWRWEKVPIGHRVRRCALCKIYRASNCRLCGSERVTVYV